MKNLLRNYLFVFFAGCILVGMQSCGDDDGAEEVVDTTPTITSVNPSSFLVGDTITITGTNLDEATEVAFGTVNATIISASETEIVVTAPEGAATGKVSVTTPSGTAESTNDLVVKLPSVELLIEDFDGNGVIPELNDPNVVVQWWTWSDPDSFNGGGSGGETTITTEAANMGSNSTVHRLLVGEDFATHASGLPYVGSSFTSNEGDPASPRLFPDLGDINDFSKVKFLVDGYAGDGETDVTLDVELIGFDDNDELFVYAALGSMVFSADDDDWSTQEIFLSQLNNEVRGVYVSEAPLNLANVIKINFGTVLTEAGGTYKLGTDNYRLLIDPN